MTLYAKWTEVPVGSFNVRFIGNDGEPNSNDQIVDEGNLVPEPDSMDKVSNRFGGWYPDEHFTARVWVFSRYTVNSDLTLYAKWTEREPKTFTVTFKADGGRPAPSDKIIAEGEKIPRPDKMTRDGYSFRYWYKESEFINRWGFDFDTVKADTILYALWERNTRSLANDSKQHAEEAKKKATLSSVLNNIRSGLCKAVRFIDSINGKVNGVLDYVRQVGNLLKMIGNIASYATGTISGMVSSAGEATEGIIDGGTSIVEGTHSIVSLPRSIQLQVLDVGLRLQNATNALVRETALLVKECRDMFAEGGAYWDIPQEVLDQYAMNNEEFKDSINIMLNRTENDANELAAFAKSAHVPEPMQGGSGGGGSSSGGGSGSAEGAGGSSGSSGSSVSSGSGLTIILCYGYIIVILTDLDTLESLAQKYLGDPDRAIDIAAYNNIASINDLEPGDSIRIPITERSESILRNRIFARREDRDNYGRDVALDDEGRIVATASGDYALTSGVENLSQAILLRLRESVAKRIRLNVYGIRTAIADPTAGIAYILSSIEQTVQADPRVSSVDDIRFSGKGDFLDVTVDYRDINNADGRTSGRV
jgi:uncharacterized repeat protein (TIGR02543 family)